MKTYSQQTIDDVIEAHKKNRNSPFKTATQTGLSIQDVFAIVDAHAEQVVAQRERFGGRGRPELEPFTVARRRAGDRTWDNNDPDIAKARADYEAGTHEMATGRDGDWLILYSIPRKRRELHREGYFQPEQ